MNHRNGYPLLMKNYIFIYESKIKIDFKKIYSINKSTSVTTNRYNYLKNNNFYFRCGISFFGGIYYGILSSLIAYYINKYFNKIGLTSYIRNKFWYYKTKK